MKQRPVALFVTPVLPLPGGSGRALRAWDWLQALSLDYRVHLLIADGRDHWPELPTEYPAEALWSLAEAASSTRRSHRLIGLLAPFLALFTRRFVIDWQRWNSTSLLEALGTHLAGETVQRIVVFRLYLQDLGPALATRYPRATCELDLDDLESHTRLSVAMALWRMGRYREAVRGLSTAIQYHLAERGIAPCYRQLYLAANDDAQHLSLRQEQVITCHPNRMALSHPLTPLQDGELGLLFVGTLNYPPNEEAVIFLVKDLVPLLRVRLASPWRLRIVGRHASPTLQALLRDEPRVDFHAEVDDLGDSYSLSHIVLVPLFAGGGTKLKTLEGFAHQRAVLSTRQGVRGLAAIPGEHYLPAECAEEFAVSIIELAARQDLVERVAKAGWAFCKEHYARP